MIRAAAAGTVLLAGLLFVVGCGDERTTAEEVKEDTGEAAESASEFLSDEREEYADKLRSTIDELDERIEDASGATAERLRESREETQDLLDRVGDASEENWESVKSRVDRTLSDIEESYEETTADM